MLATIQLLSTFWNDGRLGRGRGPARATRPRPPTTTRSSCATRPACSTGVDADRHAATSCRAPGTSRRSRSPASTPRPSRTRRTPSCRASRVRVSARVAPGQGDRAVLRGARGAHPRATSPHGAKFEIADLDLGKPFLVDTSGWAAAETLDAMHEAFGKEAVLMGSGGSIPFIADLVERYPGGADPHHRRRGSRRACPQPERVAAPSDVRARHPRRKRFSWHA